MKVRPSLPLSERWARLRLDIIHPLLRAPPKHGELHERILALAAESYTDPRTQEPFRVSAKTIEKWYYKAVDAPHPTVVLSRKVPSHAGTSPKISPALAEAIAEQYRCNPKWTVQLHYDNLVEVVKNAPLLAPLPSYATTLRYMRRKGFIRIKPRVRKNDEGFEPREMRSFEVVYPNALWHLDFHEGSRAVLTAKGNWEKPQLLGILDDHSRLCCHLQWYLGEPTAESLIHGLSQAFQKRGLPRELLMDNGGAMIAAETIEGLHRLSIVVRNTLPATPEQNGKQENFWSQIEGRLLPMLAGEANVNLELLNRATQAWVEHEYHHKIHSEIKETPLQRFCNGKNVGRESPSAEELRRAFRMQVTRKQRRSDGTTRLFGVRFELPSAYRSLIDLTVRVARWDLSQAELVDERTKQSLAILRPLDKSKNADGVRRTLDDPSPHERREPPPKKGMAPLLKSYLDKVEKSGFAPAYIPKSEKR